MVKSVHDQVSVKEIRLISNLIDEPGTTSSC